MRWTLVPDGGGTVCGRCGNPIAPGVPVALLTTRLLKRCQSCAGEPVNVDEIENERWRQQQERSRSPLPQPSGTYRHRPGFVKASAAVGDLFDGKSAALAEDDK